MTFWRNFQQEEQRQDLIEHAADGCHRSSFRGFVPGCRPKHQGHLVGDEQPTGRCEHFRQLNASHLTLLGAAFLHLS